MRFWNLSWCKVGGGFQGSWEGSTFLWEECESLGEARGQTGSSFWEGLQGSPNSGILSCEIPSPWVWTEPNDWLLFFFFFICSGFCHTLKWNSHGFTCIPHPDPPSHLPLHPLPLGFPSAPGPSACNDWLLMNRLWKKNDGCHLWD